MKIDVPKPTKDDYVNECFHIDFEEEEETRYTRDFPETDNLLKLTNMVIDINQANEQFQRAVDLYPDFDSVYFLIGYSMEHQYHKNEDAKMWFEKGLENSRSKVSLLCELGQWENGHGSFSKAIEYWIKACAIQLSTKRFLSASSFLMLEYVACDFGLQKESKAIQRQKIKIDNIRLNDYGVQSIKEQVAKAKSDRKITKSIKKAIQILCSHYKVGTVEPKKATTTNIEWRFHWDGSVQEKQEKAQTFFAAAKILVGGEFKHASPGCLLLLYEDLGQAHYFVAVFFEQYPGSTSEGKLDFFVERVVKYGGSKPDRSTNYIITTPTTAEKWLRDFQATSVSIPPGCGGYRIADTYVSR